MISVSDSNFWVIFLFLLKSNVHGEKAISFDRLKKYGGYVQYMNFVKMNISHLYTVCVIFRVNEKKRPTLLCDGS